MIFVIDSDEVMRGCIVKACGEEEVLEFGDALGAMEAISGGVLPDLILMDVMLVGPDGFTLLNELISYNDTAKIPVVIISAVEFKGQDLSSYGVVKILQKDIFWPSDVRALVENYVVRLER